jgi:hypothetical protein
VSIAVVVYNDNRVGALVLSTVIFKLFCKVVCCDRVRGDGGRFLHGWRKLEEEVR